MSVHSQQISGDPLYPNDPACINSDAAIVNAFDLITTLPTVSTPCEKSLQEILLGSEANPWLEQNRMAIASLASAAVLTGNLDGHVALGDLESGLIERISSVAEQSINALSEWMIACAKRHTDDLIEDPWCITFPKDDSLRAIVFNKPELMLVTFSLSHLPLEHQDIIYRVIRALLEHADAATVDEGLSFNGILGEDLSILRTYFHDGADPCNLAHKDAHYLTECLDTLSGFDPDDDFEEIQERIIEMIDMIRWVSPCLSEDQDDAMLYQDTTLLQVLWSFRRNDPDFMGSEWGRFCRKAILFLRRASRLPPFAHLSPNESNIEDGLPLNLGTLVSFGEPWDHNVANELHHFVMEAGETFNRVLQVNDVAGQDLFVKLSLLGEATGLLSLAAHISEV